MNGQTTYKRKTKLENSCQLISRFIVIINTMLYWSKNRQRNQQNKKKSPDTDSHVHNNFFFTMV